MEKEWEVKAILFNSFWDKFNNKIGLDSRIECQNFGKFLSILHSLRILETSFISTVTHLFDDDLLIIALIFLIESKFHSLVSGQNFQSVIQLRIVLINLQLDLWFHSVDYFNFLFNVITQNMHNS